MVDEVMEQILSFVIADVNESGFPEEVYVEVTTNYEVEEEEAAPIAPPVLNPAPSGAYYILNTSSKKFHESDCGSASKISEANKDYSTSTAEELVAMGYSPCGNCEPYIAPAPKPAPEPTQSERMVWIPNSGSKYHSYSGCSNMKNPSHVTISQAQSRGFTACKKCW